MTDIVERLRDDKPLPWRYIEEAADEIERLRDLVRSFVLNECEYMIRNKLGDPEKQHNVKWARKLGIKDVLPQQLEPNE